MFSITTRVRKNRTNRNGETSILIVIFRGKKTKEISSRIKVIPDNWDQLKSKVTARDKSYQLKNSKLNKLLGHYQQVIDKAVLDNPHITLEEVFRPNQTRRDVLLVDYLHELIESNTEGLSQGTIAYYKSTLARIKQFKPTIKLNAINKKFLLEFDQWLASQAIRQILSGIE